MDHRCRKSFVTKQLRWAPSPLSMSTHRTLMGYLPMCNGGPDVPGVHQLSKEPDVDHEMHRATVGVLGPYFRSIRPQVSKLLLYADPSSPGTSLFFNAALHCSKYSLTLSGSVTRLSASKQQHRSWAAQAPLRYASQFGRSPVSPSGRAPRAPVGCCGPRSAPFPP